MSQDFWILVPEQVLVTAKTDSKDSSFFFLAIVIVVLVLPGSFHCAVIYGTKWHSCCEQMRWTCKFTLKRDLKNEKYAATGASAAYYKCIRCFQVFEDAFQNWSSAHKMLNIGAFHSAFLLLPVVRKESGCALGMLSSAPSSYFRHSSWFIKTQDTKTKTVIYGHEQSRENEKERRKYSGYLRREVNNLYFFLSKTCIEWTRAEKTKWKEKSMRPIPCKTHFHLVNMFDANEMKKKTKREECECICLVCAV